MAEDDQLQATQWKSRYYDSLEQLEKKEKLWVRTEDLLRRAISRLTLAAEGLDNTLDEQLESLRGAFRDKADGSVLYQRVEAMSDTLLRLDQKKKASRTEKATTPSLTRLLDRLELPKGLGRKTKVLREHLADVPGSNIDPLLNEFAGLLHEAFALVDANVGKSDAGGGMLRKLFGKAAPAADQSGAPATRARKSPRRRRSRCRKCCCNCWSGSPSRPNSMRASKASNRVSNPSTAPPTGRAFWKTSPA